MPINPEDATKAYIDGLGPEALAKAASYTLGNHWLLLGGLLVSALITLLIVRSGLLRGVENRFQEKRKSVRVLCVAFVYFILSSLMSLPWSLYANWYRETQYGRTSQPLGDFLGQGAISIALSAVFGALFFAAVYWLIRRAGKLWWLWSGGLAVSAISLLLLASPILIEPLFNDYRPVPEGDVRTALVAMAREAKIPEDRIFMYDGSRQSLNFTANVSGIGPSARIAISDVAIGKASLDEVKAVTGHEIGHYVLGHVWRSVIVTSIAAMLFFFLTDRSFPFFARLFGASPDIKVASGLPVLLFGMSLFFFLAEPVNNTLTRIGETEADRYSLETVNLPDAMAGALVKSAEYRNPRPHPLQEALFYTHPSVERRVRMAMEWKAANPPEAPQQ
jgi:STE24 endopeptidase